MKRTRLLSLVLLLLFSAIWGNWLFAQISEGGLPPSFAYPTQDMKMSLKQPYKASINFSIKDLLLEDLDREAANAPLRTGVIIPTDLSFEKSGEWSTLPDGQRIWRLEISAPKAIALMLYYDEFYIPEGGKLFIYNAVRNHVIGAYTHKTNKKNTAFATEFVAGDNIVLEYVSPSKESDNVFYTKADNPKIKISGIGYGYNYLKVVPANNKDFNLDAFNDTGNWCMVNINCPEGANWQDQKKGVAKTVTPVGVDQFLCSGTVLNNTAEDLTPYFLTASHCFYNGSLKCDEWDQIIYYFQYESAGCSNTVEPTPKTMTGAQLLVELPLGNNDGSDGALLKLNDNIPSDYNVYYNGWDRTNTPATSGVGIHHTRGDVKKISTFTAPATNVTWNNGEGATNAHWSVAWVQTVSGTGVTDGGSSGSPLFNQDGRVVGSLTGGPGVQGVAKCNLIDQGANYLLAYYGKLWYHWDNDNLIDPTKTMATYLDPINSGQEVLDGTYVQNQTPTASFTASSTDIYVFQSVKYTDYSSLATTHEWSFEGGTPNASTEKNPPLITYNELGSFKTKLVINKGTADEREKEITINVTEKGTNPVSPIASFTVTEAVLLEEGFDVAAAANFPPTGWTVEKPGTSAEQWKAGNPNSGNFNTIDPSSTFSAIVAYDDNNVVDTWLKSDVISIPADARLEFYSGYSGNWLSGGYMTLYASTDGGATWNDELWTNGPSDIPNLAWAWHKQDIDLSAYAGQDVRFAWQYYGQAGDLAGIDGVKITAIDADAKITINVGESINVKDLSTGPPILYEWTFDGGTPETSDQEDPGEVKYMTPGTYDIKLKVKNFRGEHERVLTDAVTVTDQIPAIDYGVSTGYTRQSNYGLFIPTGASVDFTDKSSNYPSKWEWKLGGGTPATSAEQNPKGVKFNTAGEYDFSLKVENTAGSDEIAITKGTNVGYKRDYIWNLQYGESGTTYYTYDYGYITGTSSYYHDRFAERFDAPPVKSAITSVDIAFYVETVGSGSFTIDIMSEVARKPGTVIASVTLPVNQINTAGYTTVTFPEPVIIDGPFYVASWYWDGTGGNTFKGAILSTLSRGEGKKNTAYANNWIMEWLAGDGWTGLNEVFGDFAISMNIVPRMTYINHEGVDVKKFNMKNIDETVNTVNVKTNLPWKATTDAPWIEIVDGVNDGDAAFTFTVKDNNYNARRAFITVSAGPNYTDYVLVQQAGPNPSELTAAIANEENGEIALNWETNIMVPYKLGDNIFEDVELHPSFALDSPGEYGWSYIDGDGGTPFKITYDGEDYPNFNIPSSFIVYNPSKTNPAITSDLFATKSGKQYFACPKNSIANNDWLISPELKYPSEFKFSFWAKSLHPNYGERIRVAYSTTGKTEVDFTNVVTAGSYVTVPNAWTKYEFTIPVDAKYVAINCVSNVAFMLLVDDIFIGIGDAPESMHVTESTFTSGEFKLRADEPKTNRINKAANYSQAELQTMLNEMKAKAEKVTEITEGESGKTLKVNMKPASEEVKASGKLMRESEALGIEPKASVDNVLEAESEFPVTKLRYDDGTNYDAIYFDVDEDLEIETAIRFTPSDLLNYQGAKMKAIDVFVKNVPADGITLNIRQGEEIIHSQKATALAANKWTRISLTKEITVEASKDMYVGYKFTQKDKMAVAGVDIGPGLATKSDLISLEGDPFVSLTVAGISTNWNIALLVENKKDAVDMSYNIYRDGKVIATTTDATYMDTIMTDKACYEVTALYNGELESTPSNNACVTLSALPKPVAITDLTAAVADLVNVELTWTESAQAASYNIYRDGEAIKKEVKVAEYLDESLTPGDYCYTITVVNSAGTESEVSNEVCISVAKGTSTEGSVTVSGTVYDAVKEVYVADCDVNSVEIAVEAEDEFAKVIVNNVERTSLLVDITKPNFYTVNYSIVSHDGSQVSNHTVKVEKRFNFNSVVLTRWNNTLVVINNPENNGGYRFTSYKWFRNGQEIGTGQSYSAGKEGEQLNATDQYYVELTSNQFEGTLRTCAGTPTLKNMSVKVYPNPAKASETVYLEADVDEELLEGAYIEVYNISGVRIERIKVEGRLTPINMKSSALGTYLFVLKGKDGFSQNLKVVVNNGQQK